MVVWLFLDYESNPAGSAARGTSCLDSDLESEADSQTMMAFSSESPVSPGASEGNYRTSCEWWFDHDPKLRSCFVLMSPLVKRQSALVAAKCTTSKSGNTLVGTGDTTQDKPAMPCQGENADSQELFLTKYESRPVVMDTDPPNQCDQSEASSKQQGEVSEDLPTLNTAHSSATCVASSVEPTSQQPHTVEATSSLCPNVHVALDHDNLGLLTCTHVTNDHDDTVSSALSTPPMNFANEAADSQPAVLSSSDISAQVIASSPEEDHASVSADAQACEEKSMPDEQLDSNQNVSTDNRNKRKAGDTEVSVKRLRRSPSPESEHCPSPINEELPAPSPSAPSPSVLSLSAPSPRAPSPCAPSPSAPSPRSLSVRASPARTSSGRTSPVRTSPVRASPVRASPVMASPLKTSPPETIPMVAMEPEGHSLSHTTDELPPDIISDAESLASAIMSPQGFLGDTEPPVLSLAATDLPVTQSSPAEIPITISHSGLPSLDLYQDISPAESPACMATHNQSNVPYTQQMAAPTVQQITSPRSSTTTLHQQMSQQTPSCLAPRRQLSTASCQVAAQSQLSINHPLQTQNPMTSTSPGSTNNRLSGQPQTLSALHPSPTSCQQPVAASSFYDVLDSQLHNSKPGKLLCCYKVVWVECAMWYRDLE